MEEYNSISSLVGLICNAPHQIFTPPPTAIIQPRMFPLLYINCPGKFSPSNWAWPQKETIPDILSVKSDACLRGKIISANLIRKTNGNWYLLCIFALVNFPVGEVLGGDLHFVASVKALITLKTKHSLRSEEACLEWSTGSLLWLAEICKTSEKKSKIEIFALINVTWWKLVARSKYWHRGKYFMPTLSRNGSCNIFNLRYDHLSLSPPVIHL